jgi:tetratricopeptide (TPR) repeat protein
MVKPTSSGVPRLTQEQRLSAAGQFERANQVLKPGNLDYGMQLLLNCCLLDPANLTYRQSLRQTQKAKYENNRKGQSLAFLTTLRAKFRLKTAQKRGDHLKVLEHGEEVLMRNPWDVGTNLAMAAAFENLHLDNMAIWTLEQARQVDADNPRVNRPLARLFEKAGNFTAAMALWELVRKAVPDDLEAQHKHKDLAASATIAKGNYQEALQGTAPTPMVSASLETALHEQAATEAAPAMRKSGAGKISSAVRVSAKPEEKAPPQVVSLQAKIQADPTSPNAYLHLAALYRRADQFSQARQVLLQGFGPTANNFDIAMELIDLDIEPFRRDLAVAEDKLSRQPDSQELEAIRASLAKEIATRELDFFRRKADRFPTDTSYRFEMGVRLMRCGQVDEAIRELQAVRADPRHQGKALVYLGYCFQSRDNWRLAQRNFEDALGLLTPADDALRKEILYQLAKGYAASGSMTRAVDLACELANVDFGYKDIGKLLDEWNAKVQQA